MEIIIVLGLLAIGWAAWKSIKKPLPPRSSAAPTSAPAALAEPDPYTSSRKDEQSSVRRALREKCRDALEDKVISYDEAIDLLRAFEDYAHRFPGGAGGDYIEHICQELYQAVDDGVINPEESLELVALLGEFADMGLYRQPEPTSGRPKPAKKAPRAKATPAEVRTALDGQYLMTYVDADGAYSEREVKAKRIEQRGEHLYLVAYCLKARRPRTFRLDRVISLVDSETGEILTI